MTPKGSTPPHLRLLFVRQRQTLWAAHGFTKTSNKLKQRDIDAADRIVAEWRQGAPR